jgi:hypothetical protein
MRIKMLNTCRLMGLYPEPTLYKGKTYKAEIATNQPDYKEKGLVFAITAKGVYFLIEDTYYTKV